MGGALDSDLISIFYRGCAKLFRKDVIKSRFADEADCGKIGNREIIGIVLLNVIDRFDQYRAVFLRLCYLEQWECLGVKCILEPQSLDLFNSFLGLHKREDVLYGVVCCGS